MFRRHSNAFALKWNMRFGTNSYNPCQFKCPHLLKQKRDVPKFRCTKYLKDSPFTHVHSVRNIICNENGLDSSASRLNWLDLGLFLLGHLIIQQRECFHDRTAYGVVMGVAYHCWPCPSQSSVTPSRSDLSLEPQGPVPNYIKRVS